MEILTPPSPAGGIVSGRGNRKMNAYTIETKLIDDYWTRKFAFNAKSEKQAESKAMGWARYHSFLYGEDVRIREATEEEAKSDWFLNNEWVS